MSVADSTMLYDEQCGWLPCGLLPYEALPGSTQEMLLPMALPDIVRLYWAAKSSSVSGSLHYDNGSMPGPSGDFILSTPGVTPIPFLPRQRSVGFYDNATLQPNGTYFSAISASMPVSSGKDNNGTPYDGASALFSGCMFNALVEDENYYIAKSVDGRFWIKPSFSISGGRYNFDPDVSGDGVVGLSISPKPGASTLALGDLMIQVGSASYSLPKANWTGGSPSNVSGGFTVAFTDFWA